MEYIRQITEEGLKELGYLHNYVRGLVESIESQDISKSELECVRATIERILTIHLISLGE